MAKEKCRKYSIGIFDSGIGGLSVLTYLAALSPNKSYIYFADSDRMPYGNKSFDEVIDYSNQISDYMVEEDNIDLLVIGCNTATAIAGNSLKRRLDIPVVGVIGPGSREAVKKGKRIGIIATPPTINSEAYQKKIFSSNPELKVYQAIANEWAYLIENHPERLNGQVGKDLEPLLHKDIDTLVLGCTHYEFIRDEIQKIIGNEIQIISPAEATAYEVSEKQKTSINDFNKDIKFYVNGDINIFYKKLSRLGLNYLANGHNIQKVEFLENVA